MTERKLTKKQECFIAEYLKDFNATRAARAANYSKPEQSGYENLQKPEIKAAINAHLDRIREEGIGNRAVRLAQLNDLNEKLLAVEHARAQEAHDRIDAGEALPAGAETGLFVETKKTFGTGPRATVEVVWGIDSTLVKERQSVLEQAAREVGDRDKRLIELSGPDGGPVQIENAKAKLEALIGDDDESIT